MDDAGELRASEKTTQAKAIQKAKASTKLPPKNKKILPGGKKPPIAEKLSSTSKRPAVIPWTFPKNTLEDAIKIPRAIEEQNAGNPMKPDMLAKAVGYNSLADWRFLDLLRSANQYGLVTGSGKISPIGLTEIGQDVVAPSSPPARPKALMEAFRNVEDFRKVEEFYNGKKLPEDEFFENNLFREFSIPR